MAKKFTLIELLVVIAIIGILFSILLPSLRKARFMTKLAVCKSNLSQIAKGTILYTVDSDGWYPYGNQPGNMAGMLTSRPSVQISVRIQTYGEYIGDAPSYADWWDEPVFVCPQGKGEVGWYHPDKSKLGSLKSQSGDRGVWHSAAGRNFYNMYFDVEFGIKTPMRKIGETWTINNSGDEEFNILASDVYKRAKIAHASNATTGDMTNHIFGGDRNYPWDDKGAAHFSYGPLYYNTTVGKNWSNWALDDGSVHVWTHRAQNNTGFVRGQSSAASRTFHVPESMKLD